MIKTITINDHIISDPTICHGKPIFAGTRIMVWQILECIEHGESEESIYAAFPSLPKGAIQSALRYAKEKIKEVRYISYSSSFHEEASIHPR